jgi:actin-related protein
MDHNLALVLDLGHCLFKLGYSGEDTPRITTESHFAVNAATADGKNGIDIADNELVGREKLLFGPQLHRYNVDYKYCSMLQPNSSVPCSQFAEIFSQDVLPMLSISSKNIPVLLSEDNMMSREERLAILQLFLEEDITSHVFLLRKSLLSLYACGKTSGAILDSGAHTTTLSTVEEGYFVPEGFSSVNFGGENITDKVVECLSDDYLNILPANLQSGDHDINRLDDSFFEFERRLFARKVKEVLLGFQGRRI